MRTAEEIQKEMEEIRMEEVRKEVPLTALKRVDLTLELLLDIRELIRSVSPKEKGK